MGKRPPTLQTLRPEGQWLRFHLRQLSQRPLCQDDSIVRQRVGQDLQWWFVRITNSSSSTLRSPAVHGTASGQADGTTQEGASATNQEEYPNSFCEHPMYDCVQQ